MSMIRRTARLLQYPGMGRGGGPPGMGNLLSVLQQQAAGQQPGAANRPHGAGFDMSAMRAMQQQLASAMTPEMQQQLRDRMGALANGGGGEGFGKMGIVMMGVGENERGKKVARAAKLEIDPVTGKVSKDFIEKQLDPDDPMLGKGTVGNYDTENTIEVQVPDGGSSATAEPSSARVVHQEEHQRHASPAGQQRQSEPDVIEVEILEPAADPSKTRRE